MAGENRQNYLEMILKSKKLILENLHVTHRINLEVYNAKKEMLISDIDSLEKELGMILKSKKLILENLHVTHRINLEVYNAKKEMLISDIDSLEKELGM